MTTRLFVTVVLVALCAFGGGCGLLNSRGAPAIDECYGLCLDDDFEPATCENSNLSEDACLCDGDDCACGEFECGCAEFDGDCYCYDFDGNTLECADFS